MVGFCLPAFLSPRVNEETETRLADPRGKPRDLSLPGGLLLAKTLPDIKLDTLPERIRIRAQINY
jgi:hypothetical protein